MNIKQFFHLRARAFGIAAIGVAAIGGGLHGSGAYAASATSNATATVVTPIAISNTAALAFGKFSAGTGGTVVVSTAGSRSFTGNVVLLAGDVGSAAAFSVTGDASATYAITLPGSAATITRVSGTETMSVATFVSNPAAGATGTLSVGGAQTINVGGTLTVASAQVVGSYTGTYAVSVEYN